MGLLKTTKYDDGLSKDPLPKIYRRQYIIKCKTYTVLCEENKCNIIKKQLQNYQNGHLWKLKLNIQYLENIWKLDSENTY